MVDVGEGILTIVPKTDKLVSSLTSAINSGMSKVTANTSTTLQKVTQGATLGFIALGAAATAAIGKSIQETVEWAADVRSLQRVTGQSAESASALVAVGNELGLTVGQLTTGFGIFEKNIINGATGFTKYGIAVRDAQGNLLPFDQILGVVADKFVSLKAGPEQAAFAMNLFGRSGRSLIPILSKGAEGIAALEEEAQKMGLVMSQEDLDAAKNLSIAQRSLGEAFKGVAVTIGTQFLPIVTQVLEWMTSAVELAAKIPGPVYAITLGFLALTGAAAALIKIGQGIVSTWTTVFGAFATGAAETTSASAEMAGAVDLASTDMVAALGAVTEALGTLEVAFAGSPAAVSGFVDANGEVVLSSEAATAAIGEEEAAIAGLPGAIGAANIGGLGGAATEATGLAAAITALGNAAALAAPPIVAYFTLGANTVGTPFAGSADAMEQINTDAKEQGVLFDTLRGKVTAFSDQSGKQIHGLLDLTREHAISLGAQASAFDYAAKHGITYSDALAQIQGKAQDAVQGIAGFSAALTDPIIESSNAFVHLSTVVGGLNTPLNKFAHFSGQDVNSVKGSLAKLLSDTKATGNDIVGVIQTMKGEWRAWHDSLVQDFGGAGGALDQFSGKTHVDLGKAVGALHSYTKDIRTFGANIASIQKKFGGDAKAFISWASSQGLAQQGLVAAVADGNKKMAQNFVDNFNTADKATDNLATQIQKALDPTFHRIIVQLKNVVRQIQNIPIINLQANTSQAAAVMRSFFLRWDNQTLNAHVDISGGGPVHGGRGSGHAAGGIVTRQIATSAGPIGEAGPEAIIPLSHLANRQPTRIVGTLRIADWRQGLVDLDGELAWEDLARTS